MSPPFQVRQIGDDSLEIALSLLRRFFIEEGFDTAEEDMRALLREMLASENNAVFLATGDGEAQGVATVSVSLGLECGLSAEMDDLYVLPQARGKGVAASLIEAACQWSRARGCSVVLATVMPEGEAKHGLKAFYRRQGFSDVGRVILERWLREESSEILERA
ncbi:MAG: GNAT family N-acetyltransferase [Caldilineales bacterium]|nr:GNAT family N-acetyltransferase [Caldilineales bacterium]